jgi:predicted nuclease of predicted toxin-antitoxin system
LPFRPPERRPAVGGDRRCLPFSVSFVPWAGNRTPDDHLCDLCTSDDRVLISKDGDFVDSHLVLRRRRRLG